MLLTSFDINTRQLSALQKKGLTSTENTVRYFPYKYLDFSTPAELRKDMNHTPISVIGTLEKCFKTFTNGRLIVKAKVREEQSQEVLHISWFGCKYMLSVLESYEKNAKVLVCGNVSYMPEYSCYTMTNPYLITRDIFLNQKIHTVYRKIRGVSEEGLEKIVEFCIRNGKEEDLLPKEFREKYKLMDEQEAVFAMHHPLNMEQLEKAKQRLLFDDMLYFAMKMEEKKRNLPVGSPYGIKKMAVVKGIISKLPYELTADQQDVLNRIIQEIKSGKRISALIQGDVGCGKSIVSFLIMILMAESGYQAALLAPTSILARQHYEELSGLCEGTGIRIAYLDGTLKVREKKAILKSIEDGSVHLVVGTHTIFGSDVIYKNLALTITDEEHKFGVNQRKALEKNAVNGMHTISMSATPIPKTLATTIYEDTMRVYNIKSMPKGRKPVQTTIFSKDSGIYKFLQMEIEKGRQAYVVCPLVTENTSEVMENVKSVEETLKKYQAYFSGKGIQVAAISGKMKKEELERTIAAFKENKVQILISTTVIEVGVNNPNASVIVISNAERYGLAALHQLRGRVGRGKYDGYCILKSDNHENERLKVLTQTTDGFKIAEEDMKLRGAGNLIGTEQSGFTKFMEQVLEYTRLYERVKVFASDFVDDGTSVALIESYENANM